MTPQPDPYRTLGLTPGASVNEIRSAYRRLAKQYHPDAAGDRTLARFLAIQAAYERLVDGEGRLRPATRSGTTPREPWRADPARARASRDAWRARRESAGPASGSTGATGTAGDEGATGSGGSARARGSSGTGGAAGPRAGASGAAGSRAGDRGSSGTAPRHARKARPGSTSYDEAAAAPLDPAWDGGTWYGPSSGTYWTLNPREYADPRKHGPEYQARARRAAGERADPADERELGQDSPTVTEPEPEPEPASASASASASPSAAEVGAFPDLEALARHFAPDRLLVLARREDRRWRLALAIAGWPPIGLALASLLGDVSGCGRFAASCPAAVPVAGWLVQPLVLAVLVLVPVVAAVTAFATVAALAVAVPVAAVLAVGTVPESRAGAPVLAAAVAIAWVAGLVAASWSLRRHDSAPRAP